MVKTQSVLISVKNGLKSDFDLFLIKKMYKNVSNLILVKNQSNLMLVKNLSISILVKKWRTFFFLGLKWIQFVLIKNR